MYSANLEHTGYLTPRKDTQTGVGKPFMNPVYWQIYTSPVFNIYCNDISVTCLMFTMCSMKMKDDKHNKEWPFWMLILIEINFWFLLVTIVILHAKHCMLCCCSSIRLPRSIRHGCEMWLARPIMGLAIWCPYSKHDSHNKLCGSWGK